MEYLEGAQSSKTRAHEIKVIERLDLPLNLRHNQDHPFYARASFLGTWSFNDGEPAVVRTPETSKQSFMVIGTP